MAVGNKTDVKAKLKRGLGNWVDGDKFWDRKVETATLIEYLDEAAHVLVTAPRRVGKTSLLHEVRRRVEERYVFLLMDLEDCYRAEDMLVSLSLATRDHRKLWARTKEV